MTVMERLSVSGDGRFEITSSAVVDVADGSGASLVIRPGKDCKVELMVGRDCRLSAFIVQEKEAKVEQVSHVGKGSVVRTSCIWLSGGEGKVLSSLEGEGAEAYDLHVFIEKGTDRLHLDSRLRHAAKDTKGNILVKGIVRDNAAAKLDGMIKIEKSGGGAESFLSEHVMLLNPGAHATANPELEIENNDVSSRHAASVSQIDEDKIFYLMARGIAREDARNLIIEGFLESAVGRISDEGMRKSLMEKVLAAI
ncbi:MAG TPA: SufD family Fe-S cluster assembly protein [Candidatus Bilamarchaeum sp.]|nr:SufD family Fe-S cluster assembly protein [Candidatus Bilamarchaeum sp.]